MTDREKFLALLKEWDIDPARRTPLGSEGIGPHEVVLCEGQGGVQGYSDFFTVFKFDEQGTFQEVSIWE